MNIPQMPRAECDNCGNFIEVVTDIKDWEEIYQEIKEQTDERN